MEDICEDHEADHEDDGGHEHEHAALPEQVRIVVAHALEEESEADSAWGDLAGWLRHLVARPHGKAIVFAEARLGLDVAKLQPRDVTVEGRVVHIVLPPLEVVVELKPGETEVIGSNLDSAETARLLELARQAFQREVMADPALQARARRSAEQALTALLLRVAFEQVVFDDQPLPRPGA